MERLQRWELALLEKAATEVAVQVVPPFRAIPGARGRLVGLDYALPVDRLADHVDHGVGRLRDLYRALHAPLRVEFNESCWPRLAPALERSGMTLASRNPVMACAAGAFHPRMTTQVSVEFEAIDRSHPSRMRVLATIDGTTAGRAAIGGMEGIAELYGVVTEPEFRRRGVAGTLCSALIDWYFAQGGELVFLEADSDGAVSLYRRLGFETVDWRLTYIDG